MFQAIETKFLPPTNLKGSRYSARSGSGVRVIVDSDQSLNFDENHALAAHKLASKLNWRGAWYGGSTKDGFCFVCTARDGEPQFEVRG